MKAFPYLWLVEEAQFNIADGKYFHTGVIVPDILIDHFIVHIIVHISGSGSNDKGNCYFLPMADTQCPSCNSFCPGDLLSLII